MESGVLEPPTCHEGSVECRRDSFGNEVSESLPPHLFEDFLELRQCWLGVAIWHTEVSTTLAFPFVRVWSVECAWRLVILVVGLRWSQVCLFQSLCKFQVFPLIEVLD